MNRDILTESYQYSKKLHTLRVIVRKLMPLNLKAWGIDPDYLTNIQSQLEIWSTAIEDEVFAMEKSPWLESFIKGETDHEFSKSDAKIIKKVSDAFNANKDLAENLIERELPFLREVLRQSRPTSL